MKTNRYDSTIIAFSISLVSLTFFLGCDAVMRVHGRVYEWHNPPPEAISSIYIYEPPPPYLKLAPLEGAQVTSFYGKVSSDGEIDERYTLWQDNADTPKDGSFDLGGLCSPGQEYVALRVEQDNFIPVQKVYERDPQGNLAIVLMIRKISNSEIDNNQ